MVHVKVEEIDTNLKYKQRLAGYKIITDKL